MLLDREGRNFMELKFLFSTRSKRFNAGIFLVLLAISDSFFTDFGLRYSHITEANPMMRFVYETSVFGFYAIKISLPLVLLYVITKIEPKRYLLFLFGSTLLLYMFVLCQHVLWVTLLLNS